MAPKRENGVHRNLLKSYDDDKDDDVSDRQSDAGADAESGDLTRPVLGGAAKPKSRSRGKSGQYARLAQVELEDLNGNHDEPNNDVDADAQGGAASRKKFPPCPCEKVGWLNRVTFTWVAPLLRLGYKRDIVEEDLWDMPDFMKAGNYWRKVQPKFDALSSNRSRYPLVSAIYTAFRPTVWELSFLRFLMVALTFVRPFLLRDLLLYVSDPNDHREWYGYVIGGSIAVATLIQAILTHWYWWICVQFVLMVRGSVVGLLYNKFTKMSLAEKSRFSSGSLVSYASVDADNLSQWTWGPMNELWASPITIFLALAGLAWLLGAAAFVGVAIMLASLAFTALLARYTSYIQMEVMKHNDDRIRKMQEMLNAIRLVKLYAWEPSFVARIQEVRAKQHHLVAKISYIRSVNSFLAATVPLLVSLSTFGVYVMLGHPLTATTAFTALLLFNTLREPMGKLPEAVGSTVRAWISLHRVQRFLGATDHTDYIAWKRGRPVRSYSDEPEYFGPPMSPDSDVDAQKSPSSAANGDEDAMAVTITHGSFNWADPRLSARYAAAVAAAKEKAAAGEHVIDMVKSPVAQPPPPAANKQRRPSKSYSFATPTKGRKGSDPRKVMVEGEEMDTPLSESSAPLIAVTEEELELDTTQASLVKEHMQRKVKSMEGGDAKQGPSVQDDSLESGMEYVTVADEEDDAASSKPLSPDANALSPHKLLELNLEMDDDEADPAQKARMLVTPVLHDIDFSIPRGTLFVLVGKVGSGKSSLLHAMMGELNKLSGTVRIAGKLSYTSQQPWLLNATIRDNIVFGNPFDAVRYAKTIAACALERDFSILRDGDETNIGENGLQLSGGQKQRIALARAVYTDADVFLLDEPLSAVDAHVAKWLFDHVLGPEGILKDRTRILSTHQLQFTPAADRILVMERGRITHAGTYKELIAEGVDFASLVRSSEPAAQIPQSLTTVKDLEAGTQSSGSHVEPSAQAKTSNEGHVAVTREVPSPSVEKDIRSGRPPPRTYSVVNLEAREALNSDAKKDEKDADDSMLKEQQATGAVSNEVYKRYFLNGGNLLFWTLVMVFVVTSQSAQVGSDYFLAYWSNQAQARVNASDPNPPEHPLRHQIHSRSFYILWYGLLAAATGLLFLFRTVLLSYASIRSASTLHDNMLKALVRAPQVFFDLTPLGRILNRCAKDQDLIDSQLPGVVQDVFACAVASLGTVVLICVIAPYSIPGMAVVAAMYWWIQKYYRPSSRELKRMESVSRSPIYAHFQESFAGLAHLRLFRATGRFLDTCLERVDTNTRIYWYAFVVNRWLGVRLEVVGAFVVLIATLVSLVLRHSLGPGLVGLAVTVSLALAGNLNWMVRQLSEMEVQMNAVERVLEFGQLTSEAPDVIEGHRPGDSWPSKGEVVVTDLTVRYRKTYQPVLRHVTCHIRGGEKIGVVGRTGAGKSTLTLAMFRIIEAEKGSIVIDGVDIAKIGLRDLRSRVSIIPQDPVLFEGTVRSNLDPFSSCTDAELWTVLAKVQLEDVVSEMPNKLNAAVDANGENWSMGQRQLICLARAMVRKSKIIIMDEATASLDFHTDILIKQFLRTHFVDCTVITIAHRLDTIIDCDRIMVFDAGRVVEFESPANLLKNPHGFLTGLVRDAQTVRAKALNG